MRPARGSSGNKSDLAGHLPNGTLHSDWERRRDQEERPMATAAKAVSETRGAERERSTTTARRQAILEAAREVFLERGYGDSTVDAVVERAGGSKATVYALFGNKEGLFSSDAALGGHEVAGP